MLPTKSQSPLYQKHFDSATRPRFHQFIGRHAGQPFQHLLTHFVIDWTPVIGIDQAVLPNLSSLVNVGYARRCQLEQCLCKRIDRPEPSNLFRRRKKKRQELVSRGRFQNSRREIVHRGVPLFVRLDPACVDLRFLQSLRHVSLYSFDVLRRRHRLRLAIRLNRPGAEKGLVKQIFFIRIRRFQIVHHPFPAAVRGSPALQRTPPQLRDFRDRGHSRTDVFAAFCVVR